jgi:hypothetical protein
LPRKAIDEVSRDRRLTRASDAYVHARAALAMPKIKVKNNRLEHMPRRRGIIGSRGSSPLTSASSRKSLGVLGAAFPVYQARTDVTVSSNIIASS